MSDFLHGDSIVERWQQMTLAEQMGNIGSEISRVANSQNKNETRFQAAINRGIELFDLTIADARWHGRLQEIGRAKDVFMDAITGGTEYQSDLRSIQKYFDQFAYVANRKQN